MKTILTFDASKEAYLPILKEGKRELIPVNVFMGVDPASSTSDTADYFCIFPIAVDKEMNIYCLPYFRARVNPLEGAKKIIEYYDAYQPKWTTIETTGYQEMLRQYVRAERAIPGLERKMQPRTSKSKRLEGLQTHFARKKVFMLKSIHQAFIDELLMFPRGKHEDTIDAFFYAMSRIYPPTHSSEALPESRKRFNRRRVRKSGWIIA